MENVKEINAFFRIVVHDIIAGEGLTNMEQEIEAKIKEKMTHLRKREIFFNSFT